MFRGTELNGQSGFTITELMVVLAVMLIVMGAVMSQMGSALRVSNATFELTDAQQVLRIAQDYLTRDLVSTGDGLRGINNIRLPATFVRTYITTRPVINPSDPAYVTLPIISSDDDVAAATPVGAASPAVNLRPGTDRITLLAIDPSFAVVSLPANAITPSGSNVTITPAQLAQNNFRVGEIYFINSQYGATFGSITNVSTGTNPNLIFGNSDPYGLNAPGISGPIRFVSRGPNNQPVPTTLMRMRIIQYFVDEKGLLVRRVFGTAGAGFTESVIGDHVTNLQFRYIMNNFQQPVSHLSTAQQQVAVRQVEATVVAETVHPIINGARQQLTATTVTSVRNLQFRQAL